MTYADVDSTQRTQAGSTSFANTLLGLTAQTTSGSTAAFTRDPQGNLISMRTAAGSSYYTLDALGSVLLLTDPSGATSASYSYDPYGVTLSATGPQASLNPWRYASGYTDPTGLIKFGTRYYQPTLGRWTQQDPSGQEPGYVYAGGDPINYADPAGTERHYLSERKTRLVIDKLQVGIATGTLTGVLAALLLPESLPIIVFDALAVFLESVGIALLNYHLDLGECPFVSTHTFFGHTVPTSAGFGPCP